MQVSECVEEVRLIPTKHCYSLGYSGWSRTLGDLILEDSIVESVKLIIDLWAWPTTIESVMLRLWIMIYTESYSDERSERKVHQMPALTNDLPMRHQARRAKHQ